ncbi:MAG TPA: ATP-dependent DNA ligase [Terriglobia bacterium]|nr:ATP-dependent DNA ligase [Terriglobia bacterium]
MHRFAATADAIAGTTSKLKKIGFLAEYFRGLAEPDLRAAAVFFTGRPFPLTDARTLNVGWSALMNAVQQISGASDEQIHEIYLARGDLGEMAERLLANHNAEGSLSPAHVESKFAELVQISGASNKMPPLLDLLRALTPAETKYVIKIITGDLRIGLKENTVEEAIAKAFDRPPEAIRRANMMLGDIGETAVLAKRNELDQISLATFRPVKFMLATPAETEDEIFATFASAFYVEDKYDGIRGQLHISGGRAALYSRTLDDVGHQFPEIIEVAQKMDSTLIVDGEVVCYKDGQVLPFALLQKRLGRKRPSAALLEEAPVALMIFDILSHQGRNLMDEPLLERKKALEAIHWPPPLHLAPFMLLEERVELEPFFKEAALRRNEGLMLKDASSFYLPGKRGMSWLKWKKALATLDVVVTGVEFGHGRRRNVLSDYTFAVQHDGKLLNIGKAYSGLTDLEIAEMTEYFKQHTLQDYGRFRTVEPSVVIEVAFNGIQRSDRHSSGYALRFPRIVRIRTDKTVADIDTIATVDQIYRRHIGEVA